MFVPNLLESRQFYQKLRKINEGRERKYFVLEGHNIASVYRKEQSDKS